MTDVRGKPLAEGDHVVYYSVKYGMNFGVMKFNESDKLSYHIELPDGRMYYGQKPQYNRAGFPDSSILNLSSYVKDNYANEDVVGKFWMR